MIQSFVRKRKSTLSFNKIKETCCTMFPAHAHYDVLQWTRNPAVASWLISRWRTSTDHNDHKSGTRAERPRLLDREAT
jgi:hypothetical protein